jgi:hypothetical protein
MRPLATTIFTLALALCSAQSLAAPSKTTTPSAASSQPSRAPAPLASARSSAPVQPSQSSASAASTSPSAPPQPAQASAPATSSTPQQSSPPRYSADGLYNLANSYARAGQPGLAVLNYERAALLAPYDADIAANLEYVRTSAHVPTAPPPSRWVRLAASISPTLSAWLGVVGIALIGTALLAKRVAPRLKWIRPISVLLGAALIALTLSNAMLLWPRMHEAVVLVNQAPVLVSPVPIADTAFVLPEAETVIMTAKHDDFILVRTRAGLSGWVTRANLGAVVPEAN